MLAARLLICFFGVSFLAGCTRPIPSAISSDEYAIYSEWLTAHRAIQKNAEELLILSHTFPLKNLHPEDCPGLPARMVKPLTALGEAEYRIHDELANRALVVPFSYRLVEEIPKEPNQSFKMIRFTRATFSRDGSQGFFGVAQTGCQPDGTPSDPQLVCGGGSSYFVSARKENNHWHFRPESGCVSIE